MFGYNPYQQNYGPANALADIIGAYVQKKSQQDQFTGILKGLQNYQNQLNNVDLGGTTTIQDQANPNNPNSNYLNKTARDNAAQSLTPSTDFLGQNATANNLGAGLFGSAQVAQPQPNYFSQNPPQNINLVSNGQGNAIQNNDGTYTANLNDGTQKTIMSDKNGYAIMPQDSPQSYDWYKPDTSTKPMDQYSAANNPAKITTTAPKTLVEAKQSIMGTIPQAALELSKKGYDPSVFMPMLQQAAQDKIGEYKTNNDSQQLQTLQGQFNNSKNLYERAMIAAKMKQYGLDLDPKMISTLQPDFKLTSVDQGDRHTLVLHDPKSGTVINAESLQTNLNPNTKYTADVGYKKGVDVANISGNYGLRKANITGQYGLRRAAISGQNKAANQKPIDPLKLQKYQEAYNNIMGDIYNSSTPEERAAKISNNATILNQLGQALNIDVQNDIDYITKTNPSGM